MQNDSKSNVIRQNLGNKMSPSFLLFKYIQMPLSLKTVITHYWAFWIFIPFFLQLENLIHCPFLTLSVHSLIHASFRRHLSELVAQWSLVCSHQWRAYFSLWSTSHHNLDLTTVLIISRGLWPGSCLHLVLTCLKCVSCDHWWSDFNKGLLNDCLIQLLL